MKANICLAAIILLATILASCKISTIDSISAPQAGTVNVSFAPASASASSQRSAVPDLASNVAVYVVTCNPEAGSSSTINITTSGTSDPSCQFTKLPPGNVTVNVSAYNNASTLIATGKSSFKLSEGAGVNITIPLVMDASSGSKGNFSLKVQWPTALANNISWFLDTDSSSPIVSLYVTTGETNSADLDSSLIAGGKHLITILFRNNSTVVGTAVETVNVYNNLKSTMWIDSNGHFADTRVFTASDFATSGTNVTLRVIYKSNSYVITFSPTKTSDTIWVPYVSPDPETFSIYPTAGMPGQKMWFNWNTDPPTTPTSGDMQTLSYPGSDSTLRITVTAPDGGTVTPVAYTLTVKPATAISNASGPGGLDSMLLNGTYVLTQDIDLSGITWPQIGVYSLVPSSTGFNGKFDGGGHTISNLSKTTTAGDVGLFGVAGPGAVISNVRLKNISIISNGSNTDLATFGDGIGGIVGENYGGTITRCSVSGSITGSYRVGGIVGNNRAPPASGISGPGVITECYSTATVTATYYIAGGLVGTNWGTVSDCYARSIVSAPDLPGGLIGRHEQGIVTNCYAAGTVSGPNAKGFMTITVGTYSNCYFDATISGLPNTEVARGMPTAAMKTQSTYSGWDFDTKWTINPNKNSGYPYLRSLPIPDDIIIPTGTSAATLMSLLNNNRDGNFILNGPIILSDAWTPISSFTGTFDGNNNTISGLTITLSGTDKRIGMFAVVGQGATIKNLHLTGVNVTGATNTSKGGLVATNQGTIFRCSSSGIVSGDQTVGGLVGQNFPTGTVSECWSDVAVTASLYCGGLVGANDGKIINSYARGDVIANWGGGLVGSNNPYSTVINSYAAGNVNQSGILGSNTYIQGLIGKSDPTATTTYSYFDANKCATSYSASSTPAPLIFGTPENNQTALNSATAGDPNWDFTNVWVKDSNLIPIPHLKNNLPPP